MNAKQPNFEKVKTLFYQMFVKSQVADMAILFEQLKSLSFLPAFHKRKDQFEKDFNNWLNSIDIRQAGILIDIMIEKNPANSSHTIPNWMKKKQYYIDYNQHEFLDLIIIHPNDKG